jgi:hypothetical protein
MEEADIMDFLNWLQSLGSDANETMKGFQPKPMYVLISVLLPVTFGLIVGFGLRLIERVFGVELGKGGGH